jgi:hypothetical protein
MDRNDIAAAVGISGQCVANYEYGIRPMSFVRFLEYCFAIKASPMQVMASVLSDIRNDAIYIDLHALAEAEEVLASLREWAKRKLVKLPDVQDGALSMTWDQVDDMADVLGMTAADLTEILVDFSPLKAIEDD